MPDRRDFARLADPYRAELLAHCYRMLGSIHDAEDAVQETYLRAWRAYEGFEGRSSLRQWMYRIATNASLRTIEQVARRPLPAGLGAPSQDHDAPLSTATDLPWLQPIPDSMLGTTPDDPATIVGTRDSVRLALVAALQHLPARQRAVLILREVVGWSAAEVAVALDTTTAGVNSALQRARAQLASVLPAEEELGEPTDPGRRELLDQYAAAFENADVAALEKLLRADVELEMPPHPAWFAGREAVTGFLATRVFGEPGHFRLVPTAANGQPAFAGYVRGADGAYHAHAIEVLTITATGISRIVAFLDSSLFASFGLPAVDNRLPASRT